jgi:trimeric autotransporter adhesin
VSGGAGVVVTPGGSAQRLLHLPSTSIRDVDVRVDETFPAKPASGALFGYVIVRRQSGGAYSRIGLAVDSAGALFVRAQNAAGAGLFADKPTGLTFTPGQAYRVRVQAQGASPTTLRVRVWPVGATEPGTWLVTASDASSGPQAAGSIGVRTVNTGSAAGTVRFDNLVATGLG